MKLSIGREAHRVCITIGMLAKSPLSVCIQLNCAISLSQQYFGHFVSQGNHINTITSLCCKIDVRKMANPSPELLDELCVRFILSLPATELECVIPHIAHIYRS
jgi:hypothetical protein